MVAQIDKVDTKVSDEHRTGAPIDVLYANLVEAIAVAKYDLLRGDSESTLDESIVDFWLYQRERDIRGDPPDGDHELDAWIYARAKEKQKHARAKEEQKHARAKEEQK
jgi:hypothetical protein